MRLVSDLIDRLIRDWLTPPDEQPFRSRLEVAIDNTATSLQYNPLFLAPEVVELVGTGTVTEIGQEQIIIGDVDENNNLFTDLIRGANGTIATSHAVNSEIILSPTWPRKTIFEALGDSIINLYPELYRVTHEGPFSGGDIRLPETVQTALSAYSSANGIYGIDFNYNAYDPRYGSPSITTLSGYSSVYITCVGKFSYPERESQSLADLGIPQEWEQLIIIGTLVYLIGKEDFDPVTVESISEAIDQQGFPVRTASAIRDSTIAYYEYLLSRAKRILVNQYGGTIMQTRGV